MGGGVSYGGEVGEGRGARADDVGGSLFPPPPMKDYSVARQGGTGRTQVHWGDSRPPGPPRGRAFGPTGRAGGRRG